MSDLSWLNPTPHAIAVYASRPLSPVAAQHSLPSGRYSLLGPDFHRLDRTSLRLARSLDHLVSAQHELRWEFMAHSFGGRQIDHKIEFGWLLDRQIGGLAAAQQLGELSAHYVAEQLNDQRTVADEAILLCHFRKLVHGGQVQRRNTVENKSAAVEEKVRCQHIQRPGTRRLRRVDSVSDFLAPRDLMDRKLDAARASRVFQQTQL